MNSTAQLARDSTSSTFQPDSTHVASKLALARRLQGALRHRPTDAARAALVVANLPVSGYRVGRFVAGCMRATPRRNDIRRACGWPGMGTHQPRRRVSVGAPIVKADQGSSSGAGTSRCGRFKVGKKNTANRYQLRRPMAWCTSRV